MRKASTAVILTVALALSASAGTFKGSTTLKDLQPAGTKNKDQKHQVYDLSFDAQDRRYTCRTDAKKSLNATDFVVGTQISYEIDKNKAKIQTPEGKKVECSIVRVEASPTP